MMEVEKLVQCPVCKRPGTLHSWKTVRDHALTKEAFTLERCETCGIIVTNPRPTETAIARYYEDPNYISHSDEASGLTNWLYKIARRWTSRLKLTYLKEAHPSGKKRLLDYGCGTGYFIAAAKENNWETTGIEVSAAARKRAQDRGTSKVFSNVTELSAQDEFDVITLWHVLEHVHALEGTLRTLINHLADGGKVLIAVPNPASDDAKQYGEYWAAYDVPRHLYHFPRTAIHQLVANLGGTIEKERGQVLDAFYISMLSERYQQGSALNSILSGARSNIKAIRSREFSSIIYQIGFPGQC